MHTFLLPQNSIVAAASLLLEQCFSQLAEESCKAVPWMKCGWLYLATAIVLATALALALSASLEFDLQVYSKLQR